MVRWRLPLLLFGLTILTTTHAGGVGFSATLMSILLAHEMGHYLVARRHAVEASLPYFLPVPFVGTFGAVITMETERAGRNALLDIGAAGPIAGFVLAVPLMVLGLHLSPLVPLSSYEGPVLFFGDSMLTKAMVALLRPDVVPGFDLEAHPVFVGAWLGFVVTSLNLMPMGQLDGGHILYALAPEAAERWSRRTHAALLALGWVGLAVHGPSIVDELLGPGLVPAAILEAARPLMPWTSYVFLVWGLVGGRTGLQHPPIADPAEPLLPSRRIVALVCAFIAVLTFIPSPRWVDRPPRDMPQKHTTAEDSAR